MPTHTNKIVVTYKLPSRSTSRCPTLGLHECTILGGDAGSNHIRSSANIGGHKRLIDGELSGSKVYICVAYAHLRKREGLGYTVVSKAVTGKACFGGFPFVGLCMYV